MRLKSCFGWDYGRVSNIRDSNDCFGQYYHLKPVLIPNDHDA